MIYRVALFPTTFSDSNLDFKVLELLDTLNILYAQLTCELFVIAKVRYENKSLKM